MRPWWLLAGVAVGALLGVIFMSWCARGKRRRRRQASSTERKLVAELGQLAGGLAHEIKNPLSTINVNLKLLAEDIQRHDDDLHRRWLRRLASVQNESDRLRATLDDFLRFAGKYEFDLRPTDLRDVINELVDFFSPQLQSAGVVFRHTPPPEPVICRIDAKMFKQAMLNLLINANEAMDGGGELLVKLSADGGWAAVEVIDTGPGLTDDETQRIFDAYYSTKSGGSGLGLSTTRRIVNEHGGTIRVESEPGKGTRFIIELPIEDQG